MPKITFNLTPITDPFIQIDGAIDCDGSECNLACHDEHGDLIGLPPHYDWMESQPGCSPRIYAIGGELPKDIYVNGGPLEAHSMLLPILILWYRSSQFTVTLWRGSPAPVWSTVNCPESLT